MLRVKGNRVTHINATIKGAPVQLELVLREDRLSG